jgi:hypothetical protein
VPENIEDILIQLEGVANERGWLFFRTSAKEDLNVNTTFEILIKQAFAVRYPDTYKRAYDSQNYPRSPRKTHSWNCVEGSGRRKGDKKPSTISEFSLSPARLNGERTSPLCKQVSSPGMQSGFDEPPEKKVGWFGK